MKSALQLLVTAPDREVKRMQIIYKNIAVGDWNEARFHLMNITSSENSSPDELQWIDDAHELCDFCAAASLAQSKTLK